MSVRPITESERRQAYGYPVSEILMVYGASQGLLTHLRWNGIKVQSPWMPHRFSRITLPVFVLGGAAIGAGIGIGFFGDPAL